MKLNVAALNPAGNITLIVTTPVNRAAYADIARALLAVPGLRGEQVGFLVPPKFGGMVRLEMMGGEFCGNALRSTGYYYAVQSGFRGTAVVPVEISGSAAPLDVEVDLVNNTAKAEMPLPLSMNDITVNGRPVKAVAFEGIVHFIVESAADPYIPGGPDKPDDAFIEAVVDHAVNSLGAEAAGVMFLDRASMFMCPVVYVRETGSLVYESSCASGSTAAALTLASGLPDREYAFDLSQPGGAIKVGVTKSGGAFTELTIGGPVSIDEEGIIEI
jgi:diaminopimelate epimerase